MGKDNGPVLWGSSKITIQGNEIFSIKYINIDSISILIRIKKISYDPNEILSLKLKLKFVFCYFVLIYGITDL